MYDLLYLSLKLRI